MQAMPYNLQAKGVAEISGISISQISSSTPKWKSTNSEEREFEQFHQLPISQVSAAASSKGITPRDSNSSPVDSEPTSTLDTTRRSPSSPTSTFSSSFTGGGKNSGTDTAAPAGGSENAPAGGPGAMGMEEWDSMFPNGDGALLPWIMGENDDLGMGLKHLLQSGNPVEFEGNAGLGVVDQGSGLENLSHHPPPVGGSDLGFAGSGFGSSNGKIGAILANSSSGVLDCKVSSNGLNSNCGNVGSISAANLPTTTGGGLGFSLSHPQLFDASSGDEKPQIFNPQLMMMNPQQAQSITNPSFFMPPLGYCHQLEQHLLQPQAKRHNPGVGVVFDPNLVHKSQFLDQGGHEFLLRKHQQQQQHHQQQMLQQSPMGLAHQLIPQQMLNQKAMMQKQNQHYPLPVVHQHNQQQLQEQVVKDQLLKAADQIQTGNFSLAQEILARLNHQLSLPSKPPLVRAALYVKEALQMLLLMSNPVASPPPKTLTPFDVVHKMNAYKAFSEVSPVAQFVNFTCTQAILEALDDEADCIHVIDFDIGCGALWASLIQELPLRKRGAPSLKITAIAPLSTSHPFELTLVRENLVQFANDIGVSLEVQVVNLDLFDPSTSMPNVRTSDNESIAVSIPIWASSYRPSILPSILRFIKQKSPKIVVSMDRGFDRCDTPFPQHLIHTLESCTNFLESLDGLNITSDIVTKVEKFFVQPRIENTVLGRVHAPDKMPHWKTLFASAGLLPLQFSNFTETQADYVVKRTPGRGFHVEKRQASLVLSWQRREVVAVSAWRC